MLVQGRVDLDVVLDLVGQKQALQEQFATAVLQLVNLGLGERRGRVQETLHSEDQRENLPSQVCMFFSRFSSDFCM